MLYQKLEEICKKEKISMSRLLELSGIQRSNAKRLKNNNPTITTLLKIHYKTGYSLEWLLEEELELYKH